jgi:hypothetical protein
MIAPLDIDDLERIGKDAIESDRCEQDGGECFDFMRENWQAVIDEMRRLRNENAVLKVDSAQLKQLKSEIDDVRKDPLKWARHVLETKDLPCPF